MRIGVFTRNSEKIYITRSLLAYLSPRAIYPKAENENCLFWNWSRHPIVYELTRNDTWTRLSVKCFNCVSRCLAQKFSFLWAHTHSAGGAIVLEHELSGIWRTSQSVMWWHFILTRRHEARDESSNMAVFTSGDGQKMWMNFTKWSSKQNVKIAISQFTSLSRIYFSKKCVNVPRSVMWVEISYIYRNQMSQVSCVVLVGQTCHTLNTHSKVGYIVGEWFQRENQYLLRRSLCVISHQHDSLNSSIATSHYLSRRLSSSVSSVDEHIFCCKYLFWHYSSAERESAENWVRNKPWPRDDLTLLN